MAQAKADLIVLEPVAPDLYPVLSGQKRYHVHWDAAVPECDCKHFVFRCAVTHDCCKHIKAVREHLEAAVRCPACQGKGFVEASGIVRYVKRDGSPDEGPWECILCSGSGQRNESKQERK